MLKMRSRMQNQKGFTLVELMVVVVILGILVAIAVPVYNNVTKQANQKAVEANLRTIDGAVMQYEAATNGTKLTTVADGGGVLMTSGSEYLKVWPKGPDGVVYTVANGKATARKGSAGDWFGTGPYTLPVTWP